MPYTTVGNIEPISYLQAGVSNTPIPKGGQNGLSMLV